MLLSLPPLLLGLFGGIGYIGKLLGPDTVDRLVAIVRITRRDSSRSRASRSCSCPPCVTCCGTGAPTSSRSGSCCRSWSGSRALNVFVDTIAIMYGQVGRARHPAQRFLTFGLYIGRRSWSASSLHPARPARSDGSSGAGSPDRLELPHGGLLAAGARRVTSRRSRRCSTCHPAPVAVVARHPGSPAGPRDLAPGVLRRARARSRPHSAGYVDLRAAQRPDRAAHLALRPGHRHPHRGRPQRGHACSGRSSCTTRRGRRLAQWAGSVVLERASGAARLGGPDGRLRATPTPCGSTPDRGDARAEDQPFAGTRALAPAERDRQGARRGGREVDAAS